MGREQAERHRHSPLGSARGAIAIGEDVGYQPLQLAPAQARTSTSPPIVHMPTSGVFGRIKCAIRLTAMYAHYARYIYTQAIAFERTPVVGGWVYVAFRC